MVALLIREPDAEWTEWLAERKRLGHDRYDEEWDGLYIVTPGPGGWHQDVVAELTVILRSLAGAAGLRALPGANIGRPGRFVQPDVVALDRLEDSAFFPSARLAVEVRSPGQHPDEKLPKYLELGVDEVVLVDPQARTVRWLANRDGAWHETDRSEVLGVPVSEIVEAIRWPG